MNAKQQLNFDQLRAANEARNKLWDPDNKLPVLFHATELGGEIGELLNVVKKFYRAAQSLPGSKAGWNHLQQEFADVIICTDKLAMKMNVDLAEAVAKTFNATSEKHNFPILIAATGDVAPVAPPIVKDPLVELAKKAHEKFLNLTPEQQAEHRREQRRSWVRAELMLAYPLLTTEQADERVRKAEADLAL